MPAISYSDIGIWDSVGRPGRKSAVVVSRRPVLDCRDDDDGGARVPLTANSPAADHLRQYVGCADRDDGGGGTDTLQIGTVGAGITVDLSAAATDGANGFLNIEALTLVNSSTASPTAQAL
jgi:hypothetical protein